MNFGYKGYERTERLDFVVGIESEFYAQMHELYQQRIET